MTDSRCTNGHGDTGTFRATRPRPRGRLLTVAVVLALALVQTGCATNRRRPTVVAPRNDVPALWPLQGHTSVVSAPFGQLRRDPLGGTRNHRGIDIAAEKGTPVVATADGVVVFAGRDGAYGRVVRIRHAGGRMTVYAHLRAFDTARGRRVRQGQVIGRVGASGRATGPHIHYEVWEAGRPVDPQPFLPPRGRRNTR